jgi:hypothetical protein
MIVRRFGAGAFTAGKVDVDMLLGDGVVHTVKVSCRAAVGKVAA